MYIKSPGLGFPWLAAAIIASAAAGVYSATVSSRSAKRVAEAQKQAAMITSESQSKTRQEIAKAIVTGSVILGGAWIVGKLLSPRPVIKK